MILYIHMLTLEDMVIRLVAAIVLGAVVGLERELAGKEAGVRTDVMVASGAAIFSMVGISLPYIVSLNVVNLQNIIASGGFFSAITNVVVGVGFLGAGIIVKQGIHVHGLTTAATVWFVAAIGVLAGLGLLAFAAIASCGLTLLLIFLRKMDLYQLSGKGLSRENDRNE